MRVGISVVKSCAFRGGTQEFSNTYNYELETAITAPAETLGDEVVAKERDFHSSSVAFVRYQVWSTGGTKAENQMLFAKNLTGTGTQSAIAGMDKERAVLVRWRAGVDTRGLPVYLRKWWHSCGNFAGTVIAGTAQLEQTAGLSSGARAAIATAAQGLKRINGNLWLLVAKNGREPDDSSAVAHPHLEHHQLGDQWR